jgi:serine protease Do
MRVRLSLAVAVLLVLAGCGPTRTAVEKQAAVADALAPSLVRVQYTLRYDKGDEPDAGTMELKEERPWAMGGFLVAPDEVLAPDPQVHPRFIERVAVRLGDDVVPARLAGWGKRHNAVRIRLDAPLEAGVPLAFDASKKPPYLGVTYAERGATWQTAVEPFEPPVSMSETGRRYRPTLRSVLVVDAEGTPVGLSVNGEIPVDDSWKGSPLDWPFYTAQQRTRMLADTKKRCERALPRVTFHLRSPKRVAGDRYGGRDEIDTATEIHATGLLLEGGRILVFAELKPKVTARLEGIAVHVSGGKTVPAKFVGSLATYGCLVAELEKPLVGAVALSEAPVRDVRQELLLMVDIRQHGANRTAYFNHGRFDRLNLGWQGQLYLASLDRDQRVFAFDPAGSLVAMPLPRRQNVAVERRWSSVRPRLVPVARVRDILADLAKHTDASNVPLSEATEQRLAWLGVILQPLGRDLARANGVAQWTKDGESGAIVSYVYPDSPAAKAGVAAGVILLRLRAEGQVEPLEVQLEDHYDRGPFPWDQMDEVPETYYERIPPPWQSAENSFTRALTDLGFGRRYQAEFFIDGRIVTKRFEVTPMPTHYESAGRHKAAALGLTVRDLTYEVRRYFQKAEGEPGIIVSRVEPGSKASVAGIKPYEIVTHVNARPVADVKEFAKAVATAGGELRLSVKRMMQGRVVKMSMAPESEPPP